MQPLLQNHLKYLAVRLVWTNKNDQAECVWKYITNYQYEVCEQLKGIPGVLFFLSSITATVTMATRAVHPGIAFWLAADPQVVQEYQIYTALRNNTYGASLKIITHRTANNEIDRHVNNVSMAVKDFGPGYVQDKIRLAGLPETRHYLRERIYMRSTPEETYYIDVLSRAQQILASQGLVFHLERF